MRECMAEGCPHLAADGCDFCDQHDEPSIKDGDLIGSNYMQAYGAAAAERLRRLVPDERGGQS